MQVKLLKYVMGTLLFTITSVYAADSVHVTALEKFSTNKPSNTIDVVVLAEASIGDIVVNPNDVIHCDVVKISSPKRGKRSASLWVKPISYTSNGNTVEFNEDYIGKYSKTIISKEELKNVKPGKVATKAAVTVGNHFVKGLAPVASLAKGVIKNEDGNRIESGVKQVYKDSPLSYIEKGKDLDIEQGDSFYLTFKLEKDADTDSEDE